MESLDGVISRVLFHKQSKYNPAGIPFCIAKLSNGIVVKGEVRRPVVGERYRFWGSMMPQKGGYPDAFEFHSYEAVCDKSDVGITTYLARQIDGIGTVKAARLVEEFGADTLDVLRSSPEKALFVPGITEEIVENIRTHFADSRQYDPAAYARLIDLFSNYRISKRVVESLLMAFGSNAPDMILENPYILMDYPRTGWKTTDCFALSEAEYDREGIERHQAAIIESLERAGAEGHTCMTWSELTTAASTLLGGKVHPEAIDALLDDSDIVESRDDFGAVFQLASLAEAEETVAAKLADLIESGGRMDFVTPEWSSETGLGDDQVEAALRVERFPVVIVTGAPGVGKSYLLSRVISRLGALGRTGIRCVAPTGKAAKRMAELLSEVPGGSEIPSTTIHRALEPMPAFSKEGVPSDDARFGRGRPAFGFQRDEQNPLDSHIIIIDELSMVDAKLMASLLRAVKPGTRLICVGDANQLPSVGPGSVLRDMMAAGVPTATLTQIRRSDGGGTIVRACHAIKDGEIPLPARRVSLPNSPTDNWVHIEISEPREIADKIVELATTTKTFDKLWGVQVISPQKARLPIGCDNLNRMLSRTLNPENPGSYAGNPLFEYGEKSTTGDSGSAGGSESEDGPEPAFRVGDKVVRTKNGLVDELIEWDDCRDEQSIDEKIDKYIDEKIDKSIDEYVPAVPAVPADTLFSDVVQDSFVIPNGFFDTSNPFNPFDPFDAEVIHDVVPKLPDIAPKVPPKLSTGRTVSKFGKLRPDLHWQGRDWVARPCPVVNGDLGQIEDILLDGKPSIIVRFRDPERLCRLPYGDSHIILAYALTVHKMQGSGAPYVVFPLHHSFFFDTKTGKGLWNRELVYTAISRSEQLLVTVGKIDALATAISRKTVNRRKTTLARRLRREFEGEGEGPGSEVSGSEGLGSTATELSRGTHARSTIAREDDGFSY